MQQPQVFQTNSSNRWQRFKWSSRLLLFILLCAVITLGIAIYKTDREQHEIPLQGRAQKKALTEANPLLFEGKLAKRYKGFRKFINSKWVRGNGCGQRTPANLSSNSLFNDSVGIRAAFFVEWDAQSLTSLEDNISRINLVLPEWIFIDSTTDAVRTNINPR